VCESVVGGVVLCVEAFERESVRVLLAVLCVDMLLRLD